MVFRRTGSTTPRRSPVAGGPGGGLGGVREAEIISGSRSIGIVFEVGGGGLREGMLPALPGTLSSSGARLNSAAAGSTGLLCEALAGTADRTGVPGGGAAAGAGGAGLDVNVGAAGGGDGSARAGGAGSSSSSSRSTSMSAEVGTGGSNGPPEDSIGGTAAGICTARLGSSTMMASKRSAASRGNSSSLPGRPGRPGRPDLDPFGEPAEIGDPAESGDFGP